MKQNYTLYSFQQVVTDAVVMEQLSGSPRIMSMYSLCGTSLVVPNMPVDISKTIVPPGEWSSANLEPRNTHIQPSTKLSMALEMALSLQDLHGYKGGVIVHGDVQLGQWLRNDENATTLVLGDFNLAQVLPWNPDKQQYCTFERGRGHGHVSKYVLGVWLCDNAMNVLSASSQPRLNTQNTSTEHRKR